MKLTSVLDITLRSAKVLHYDSLWKYLDLHPEITSNHISHNCPG